MGKILRVGFIGAGGASFDLFPGFIENPNAEIFAITSRTEKHAKKAALKVKAPHWYTDHEKMLAREDLDAIVIATPNALHANLSLASTEAGCHVLCEKPMALSLREADEMISSAEKNHVLLMPAYCERFHSLMPRLKEIIRKGLFGEITHVRGRKAHLGPDIAWQPHATWFFDATLAGGGAFLDLGSHVIDYLQYLFGDIRLVLAASFKTKCKKMRYDDTAIAVVQFENEITGVIEAGWCSQYADILEIHGTKGSFRISRDESVLYVSPTELSKHPSMKQLSIGMFKEPSKKKMVNHFIECILNDKTPLITARDGRKVISVIEAAEKSARTRQVVEV
ncbi:MAG: Gfo/Idh/MocA family protein [Candidatus Helarchaeota archaeon]